MAFNHCRLDAEFSERALYHMIEIYLNPGLAASGGEGAWLDASSAKDHRKSNSSMQNALIASDQLLRDNSLNSNCLKVLKCRSQMASGEKAEIEKAVNQLLDLLNEDKDYIPALFFLAMGYHMLGQSSKSKTFLKHIIKQEWRLEYADELEKARLVLAELQINASFSFSSLAS